VNEDTRNRVYRHNDHCKPLFDIEETAEILNISSHTVRALVKTRKITFVKLGARVLFRPQDLVDFIDSRLVPPQAGPRETVS
jgi:excisionase family DNA binding protein